MPVHLLCLQNGGQETTLLTTLTQLTHQGMIFVPNGYSFGPALFGMDTPHGGTPYGCGTLAGPTGARQPSEVELGHAKHQVLKIHSPVCVSIACLFVMPRASEVQLGHAKHQVWASYFLCTMCRFQMIRQIDWSAYRRFHASYIADRKDGCWLHALYKPIALFMSVASLS